MLLHVPPDVASLSVKLEPAHIGVTPVIAAGVWLTVITWVAIQPAADVKVIVELPADTPLYIPVPEPIVATARLLLLHVLLPEASVTVALRPVHTENVPPIADGNVLTVTGAVMIQPVVVIE